jgi:hypothetical protein
MLFRPASTRVNIRFISGEKVQLNTRNIGEGLTVATSNSSDIVALIATDAGDEIQFVVQPTSESMNTVINNLGSGYKVIWRSDATE